MNRESRQAREVRRAARPIVPPDPFRNVPKRPWTRSRVIYTTLLWLLWAGILGAFFLMGWRAGERSFSVLLVAAPRMAGVAMLYWVGVALLFAIPLRLLVDNLRMSYFAIFLGGWAAIWFSFHSRENLQGLDRNVIVHHVYKKQVVLRKLERMRTGRKSSSYGAMSLVDNPAQAGQLIEFPPAVMSGSVGAIFCVDVVVGQFGGVWALPPEKCPELPEKPP